MSCPKFHKELPLPVFLSHLGAQGWRLVSTEDSAATRDYILERER